MIADDVDFYKLYRENHRRIRALCFSMLRNHSDADDVTQLAFIKAFRNIDKFEARQGAKFSTWLHRIAVNEVKMFWVRLYRQLKGESAGMDCVPCPSHQTVDELLAVKEALQKLPVGYKNALILYGMMGYEHAEIAQILGCHEGTSKSQVFKARHKLDKELNRKANPRIYNSSPYKGEDSNSTFL